MSTPYILTSGTAFIFPGQEIENVPAYNYQDEIKQRRREIRALLKWQELSPGHYIAIIGIQPRIIFIDHKNGHVDLSVGYDIEMNNIPDYKIIRKIEDPTKGNERKSKGRKPRKKPKK